jgi:hypothetical protein
LKVVITIDTEADDAWRQGERITVENLHAMPRLQALCDRYGMKPTYLCTYEVARAEAFAPLVKWQDDGRCEIGAHLHPWTNPPFQTSGAVHIDPSEYPGYPSELLPDRFRAKMIALGQLLRERCGRAPTSYRAGRWGFAPEHIPVLLELGYIVDCSVTPLIDRRRNQGLRAGGPDFRRAPLAPYRLSPDDICAPGDSALWEVPVTVVHTSALMRRSAWARTSWSLLKRVRGAGALQRLFALDPTWFRPYPHMDAKKLLRVYRRARALGVPVIEMMLHSSELMAGASDDFPDAPSIERAFAMLEETLATLAAEGCRGVTLSEFVRTDLMA